MKIRNKDATFIALTIIDPVTNLTELVRVDNKTVEHVANKFAYTWLTNDHGQRKCIHDNEGEITGWEFQNSWINAKLKILLPRVGILQITLYANTCIRQ